MLTDLQKERQVGPRMNSGIYQQPIRGFMGEFTVIFGDVLDLADAVSCQKC